jgi:hypothetical protein
VVVEEEQEDETAPMIETSDPSSPVFFIMSET